MIEQRVSELIAVAIAVDAAQLHEGRKIVGIGEDLTACGILFDFAGRAVGTCAVNVDPEHARGFAAVAKIQDIVSVVVANDRNRAVHLHQSRILPSVQTNSVNALVLRIAFEHGRALRVHRRAQPIRSWIGRAGPNFVLPSASVVLKKDVHLIVKAVGLSGIVAHSDNVQFHWSGGHNKSQLLQRGNQGGMFEDCQGLKSLKKMYFLRPIQSKLGQCVQENFVLFPGN